MGEGAQSSVPCGFRACMSVWGCHTLELEFRQLWAVVWMLGNEWIPGPLGEQSVFLTTELSLQPHKKIDVITLVIVKGDQHCSPQDVLEFCRNSSRQQGCSCRGPRFSSQQPYGSSQPSVTLFLGDSMPSSWLPWALLKYSIHACTHTCMHSYIHGKYSNT